MKKANDIRRSDPAYRIVQDLNEAGLLRDPWNQFFPAQKIVKQSLRERVAESRLRRERQER